MSDKDLGAALPSLLVLPLVGTYSQWVHSKGRCRFRGIIRRGRALRLVANERNIFWTSQDLPALRDLTEAGARCLDLLLPLRSCWQRQRPVVRVTPPFNSRLIFCELAGRPHRVCGHVW